MSDELKRLQALYILELDEHATWPQIETAYQCLMARYNARSLASYGLLRSTERNTLLEAIGKSYGRLYAIRSSFPQKSEPIPQTSENPKSPQSPVNPAESMSSLPESSEVPNHDNIPSPDRREPDDLNPPKPIPPPSGVPEPLLHKQPSSQGVRSAAFSGRSASSEFWPTGAILSDNAARQAQQVQLAPQKWVSESVLVLPSAAEHDNDAPRCGDVLRLARESHNMSLAELAQQLMCSAQELQALERDDYQYVVSSRALRSLIEIYANTVGLDRQQTVIHILSAYWNWRADRRKSH